MQKHRPVRGIAFPFLVGIGVLALAIATIAAFIPATSSLAAEGDGTQLFGGPTAGAAGTVSLSGPGDSKQYVVSAVVPADTNGGYPPNLGGAHIHLDYDESKVTATCQVGTLQSISCNPDNAGKVTIAFAQVSNQGGQGVGVTSAGNPTTIATITFTAKAGVQNTADAIVARQLVDCRNGNNEHLNCSTNFGALAIGGGGGQPGVCDAGTTSVNLASGFTGVLWCGSAVPVANFAATLPGAVTRVYQFNLTSGPGGFRFWDRPLNFSTLQGPNAGLNPGGFYIFQTTAAAVVNFPNPGTFQLPSPGGSIAATTGFTGAVWSGNAVPVANLQAELPNAVTRVYQFNLTSGPGGFRFWDRPLNFSTLQGPNAGLNPGGFYIFQTTSSVNIPMD